MYSAYLYLAAVALAESDGWQRFALECDIYMYSTPYMGSISVEVLIQCMCHSTFIQTYVFIVGTESTCAYMYSVHTNTFSLQSL